MATQFLPHLSQDFTKLLESKKKHDVIIKVDKSNNEKTFCAHSIILETRSVYFENVFSNKQFREENNIFILEFPDLSSDIFDILIRYIYGGIINLDNKKASDILNLLTACGRFKLKELYDYVQQDLIEHHHDWLFQNLFLVQKISFKNSDFTKLQNYWTTTICEQPEILFNATDFTSVDKEALLSICKEENSCMEENELWDHIIRWGKAQNTELSEEINNWTPKIILSRIQNYDNAINQYGGGPNFNDLQLTWTFNVDNGATYNKKAYNKKIHNEGSFIVSEYEVFGITRKRQ
ncbi:unnamed protein product [Rhizophagus irregularis]|nr:unnamed protein product [Rhizophagus irregularis]